MTTTYHTAIPSSPAQPANASTVNNPLGELDAELVAQDGRITTIEADMPVLSGVASEFYNGSGGFSVPSGTGSTNGHVVQDEGVDQTQRAKLNFTGAGVTVVDTPSATEVQIAVSDHGTLTGLNDADHVAGSVAFTATDKVLGRSTSGAGAGEEIPLTAAGRALIAAVNAEAQRVLLETYLTAYKIAVSVVSNDLVLSLTHVDGTTPSTSRPLWFLINGAWRAVSAATTCTLADGTNWMNLGAAETATIEQDLFAYVIWDSNSSVVAIAPSRIPYGKLVSDFNSTTTNERYIGNYSNYTSTDDVAVIGRFAATLSAGAGYTWTVPTFTGANLIQRSIYETRWLTYTPTIAGYSSNPTSAVYMYQVEGGLMRIALREVGDGISNNTTHTYSTPFSAATRTNMSWYASLPIVMNNGVMEAAGSVSLASASASMAVTRSALGAWTPSGACRIPSAVLMCEV